MNGDVVRKLTGTMIVGNAVGGAGVSALPERERDDILVRVLLVLRGPSVGGAPKLLHLNTSSEAMDFVNSQALEPLAALAAYRVTDYG